MDKMYLYDFGLLIEQRRRPSVLMQYCRQLLPSALLLNCAAACIRDVLPRSWTIGSQYPSLVRSSLLRSSCTDCLLLDSIHADSSEGAKGSDP